MKLGPVNKLVKKTTETSKIVGQFGASRKLDSGCMVCTF